MGTLICVITGLIISYMTEENNPPVPKKYLSPVVHPFLSKNRIEDDIIYKDVKDARRELSITEEPTDEEKLKERMRKISYISEKFDD